MDAVFVFCKGSSKRTDGLTAQMSVQIPRQQKNKCSHPPIPERFLSRTLLPCLHGQGVEWRVEMSQEGDIPLYSRAGEKEKENWISLRQTNNNIQTNPNTHTYRNTHKHIHAYTHTQLHTHMHTTTHAHTHIGTYMHIETHIRLQTNI